MEKLAIGLLRSSNSIQIKKAFVEKLISSGSQPSPNYNLTDFISELESLWSIQNTSDADSNNVDKLKTKYDSFQTHYNLIQSIVNYFLALEVKKIASDQNGQNLKFIETKIQDLLTHFNSLIKTIFECNVSEQTVLIKRENFLLLIVWLRLLSESLINGLRQFQLSANFINILTTINMFLKQTGLSSTHFLYFIQNDSYFCDEYLKFAATFLDLIDEKGDVDRTKESLEINKFILDSLLETNCIIIR